MGKIKLPQTLLDWLLKIACRGDSETTGPVGKSDDGTSIKRTFLATGIGERDGIAEERLRRSPNRQVALMGLSTASSRRGRLAGVSRSPVFFLFFFVLFAAIALFLSVFRIPNLGVAWSFLALGGSLGFCADFSKGPMVQLIGDGRAMIVWESCGVEDDAFMLTTNDQKTTVEAVSVWEEGGSEAKRLYRAFLDNVKPGPLEIAIALEHSKSVVRALKMYIPPPQGKRHLRVAVLGDNQQGVRVFSKALSRIKQHRPDVVVHVGDMVQVPYQDSDWQKLFFDPLKLSGLMQDRPFIITQGNHDVYGASPAPYFSRLEELRGEPTGYYYAQTIGGTRFIVCDSNIEDHRQLEWLKAELAGEETRRAAFRIVSVHVPPFIEYWDPVAWRRGERRWPYYVRNNMVRIFEEGRVDLVLSGHQHNYQRGTHQGVTYVVTGGAGGSLDSQRVEEFDNIYQKTVIQHHFVMLDITPRRIHLTMQQVDGKIGDKLTIYRRHN